jgi:uncharacterized protein YndB with AHSA1/START domain
MAKQATDLGPITKSVTVGVPVERAFAVFTDEIATWWPLETHSVSEKAETCVFEGRQGGRIYEIAADGEKHVWGTVVVWKPPARVVYTWHPGRSEERAQEVEMRFRPESAGTRVDIEHRGWERLGDEAPAVIQSYTGGWDYVLGECYVGRVNAGK